jgi:hypothetical protein
MDDVELVKALKKVIRAKEILAALTAAGWQRVGPGMVVVPMDCRKWAVYPIQMPINAEGHGPSSLADAVIIQYEVWDQTYLAHASYDNLPDAINRAMLAAIPKEADNG